MTDVLFITALALLTIGWGMVWLPLAPIVLGTLMLAGIVWARLTNRDNGE